MGKPGDFFVGVTDLFSVLLPGAIVAYLIHLAAGVELDTVLGVYRLGEAQAAVAFLVAAFILGNLTDMAGAVILDGIYDLTYADYQRSAAGVWPWLKHAPRDLARQLGGRFLDTCLGRKNKNKDKGHPKDPLYTAALSLAKELPQDDRLYQWCRDWLQVHSPQALAEPDRLQASSKFFRGLVVLTAVFVLLAAFNSHFANADRLVSRPWMLVLGCTIGVAAFLRFCDLRWKAVHHVYRLYVISRQTDSQAARGVNDRAAAEHEHLSSNA